jgi:hypothetical protein
MTQTLTQIELTDPASIARWSHNDILQSLGVAVLGVDLCRRLHHKMRYEQALDELTGIVDALTLALASSEQVLPELDRLMPPAGQGLSRPSLVLPSPPARGLTGLSRPATTTEPMIAGPQEIVETLDACLTQARRCRSQYDAGLGDETMRDLELLSQRLEFASIAFRQVMGALRQMTAKTFMPMPAPARPTAPSWIRTA